MKDYITEIKEVSKPVTAKEKIKLKDVSNAVSLDAKTQEEGKVIINPDYYAILNVHNERSEDKEYTKYIVVDKDGTKYVTGSNSFFTSLIDIMDDMTKEAPDEDYSIEVYRKESSNYKGKTFITCALV